MMNRSLFLLLPLTVALVMAVPSGAHDVNAVYPLRWDSGTHVWRFTASVPTGNWRDRVRNGVAQWNNLNQSLKWSQGSEAANYNGNACPTNEKNGVHYKSYDGSGRVLAYVILCYEGSGSFYQIHSANFTIDNDENWYRGTGDATSSQIDLWSIVSHEWGHMTGWQGPAAHGHYNETADICADNSAQHTMCPAYKPGTERMRTLETHDKHTFNAAY